MSQTSTLKGQCIAEFLGTGLLIFFGVGCVAALKVAGATFGQWEISIIWGLGVAMAIYLTAGVSGAHLNPAVTIALWLFACFDGRKVVPFIVAQFAGAFCAAAPQISVSSSSATVWKSTYVKPPVWSLTRTSPAPK